MKIYYLYIVVHSLYFFFFFFNDTATTEIYTLSLHDALPISSWKKLISIGIKNRWSRFLQKKKDISYFFFPCIIPRDRKSTRLNSSHGYISYAVFCLKKKKKNRINIADAIHQKKLYSLL